MNDNRVAAVNEAITQQTSYVTTIYFSLSSFVLLLYVALLKLPEEVNYIWPKRHSLPALLYMLTRYGTLVYAGFTLALNIIMPIPAQTCHVLVSIQTLSFQLIYIGLQGLLIARAYSLCGGNKVLALSLAITFFLGLSISIFEGIKYNICVAQTDGTTSVQNILNVVEIISTISTDLIVFGVCIWTTWGAWVLIRGTKIRNPTDITSALVRQSIMRCCFVVIFTVSLAVFFLVHVNVDNLVVNFLTDFQNTLSSVLVADFTLELYRRNSKEIEANNISFKLSHLSFQSCFEHIHQSFSVGMATPAAEHTTTNRHSEHQDGGDVESSSRDGSLEQGGSDHNFGPTSLEY